MQGFFHAQSAAILGVSPRPGNLGRIIAENFKLYNFLGPVFYVSPRGGELDGQPIYASVADLPLTPDLGVILTPAATVAGLLEECGKKGIKRVVVESAGFSELDASLSGLETQLCEIARRHDMRFIGPNCLGVIGTHSGVATPFSIMRYAAPKGGVSLIAQSGGIGLTYLLRAAYEGIGFAKFASVGNKTNVNEEDLLAYFIEDPLTEAILLYLESITDGRRLFDLIRSTDKPVIIHKANIGGLSNAVAQSHTAALANDDKVVEAALEQAGAIRAHTVNDCQTLLKGFVLPKPKGKRLAVVSRSGGHAVVAADECLRRGMELPPLPASYLERIQEHVRAAVIRLQNPLDLGDLFEFNLYVEIIRGALAMDSVDAVVLMYGFQGEEVDPSLRFLAKVGDLCRQADKPVALVILADNSMLEKTREVSGLPLFQSPEEAIFALEAAARAAGRSTSDMPGGCDDDAKEWAAQVSNLLTTAGPNGSLELPEALQLVAAAGVPVAPFKVVGNPHEATVAARSLGFPVCLKAVGSSISHKTDQDGVVLDLNSEAEVEKTAADLFKKLALQRLVVMKMISGGQEVIVGVKTDSSFGPVVLFGRGGVEAEVVKDFQLRLPPIDSREAGAMLDKLHGAALLKGFRGRPPVNRPAVIDLILRVATLAGREPKIMEMDLNPVIVGPNGAMAVDARIRFKRQPPSYV